MKMFDASVDLATISTIELHTVADELEAHIWHPTVMLKPSYQRQSKQRLQQLLDELDARWAAVWRHPDNEELSNDLYRIYLTT
ncbi:hypothetical protein PBI_GAIA_157 [Mycobacterium phage Gaia]|uniref:Uncharacterized protein n=1 Tax=Mycobacterium phage Gaia TaxID=1486472 RepID=A0A068F3P4_9CAUD|nr:hypothetical protein VC46_gp079 [Mycobacterium phage Gaia]AID58973.1 hypothetical protein PBI_GAIA_157 [Mycobacterium phage Gaia]